MNKNELARLVAAQTGLSLAQAEAAVNSTLTAIGQELAAGGDVRIAGFGNFSVSRRAERRGRNPQTGEPLIIPKKTVPKFSPGTSLKKAVDEGDAEAATVGDTTIDP